MNLHEKLLEIRKEMPHLQKDSRNDKQRFNYVSSTNVLTAVRSLMDQHRVLLIPEIENNKTQIITTDKNSVVFTELEIIMKWVDCDNITDTITCKWYGQGVDYMGEKGVGKALTYAEKYFILKFFNIPTDNEDPDADQSPKEKIVPVTDVVSEIKSCKTRDELNSVRTRYGKFKWPEKDLVTIKTSIQDWENDNSK